MKKIFSLIVFFVLLLIPFGAHNAFAVPGQGTIYAVEPFSNSLYTVSSNGVFTFVGNTNDGTSDIPINTLAYDPTSNRLYGGQGEKIGNLHIVDKTNAHTTLVGNNGVTSYDGLDFGIDGTLYGVLTNGDLVTVDKTTGAIITTIGDIDLSITAISFDKSGILWALEKTPGGNLYTIDTTNAHATLVRAIDASVDPASLQILCDGTTFVGTVFLDQRFGTLDRTTGAFTELSIAPGDTIGGLTVSGKCTVVGGTLIPIDYTTLLIAGAQSTSWIIPLLLSGIGIGLFVSFRKSENY